MQIDRVRRDSLVDKELVDLDDPLADWARPLRGLLVDDEPARRLKALQMVAQRRSDRSRHPHIRQLEQNKNQVSCRDREMPERMRDSRDT